MEASKQNRFVSMILLLIFLILVLSMADRHPECLSGATALSPNPAKDIRKPPFPENPAKEEAGSDFFHSGTILVSAISFILITALIVLWWQKRREARFYRRKVEAEHEGQALVSRFDSLTKYANDMIILANHDQKIIEANQRACSDYGYTREEFLNLHIRDLRTPETRKGLDKTLIRAEEEQGLVYETLHQRKNGASFPAEVSLSVIEAEGQKFYQAIIRDITERKKSEKALKESEEKLRLLFESVNDGLFVIDLNGVYTEVNRRYLEMHRFNSKEELFGKNVLMYVAPRNLDRAKKDMQRTLEEGKVTVLEYNALTADGMEFPVEITGSLLKDVHGNPMGFIGIERDVTERKRAEEALRESEERYRSVVENANDAIYVLSGNHFTYVNPRFKDLLGYKAEEICNQEVDFMRLVAPESRELIARKSDAAVPSRYEFKALTKSGEIRDMEVSTVNLGRSGKMRVLGILRDITERKRTEEQIKASLQEKEVLLKEIHHRVKNNMQIMSSLLSLQSRHFSDKDIQEIFKECQNRIRSMALVHEKLYHAKDFSQINLSEYIRNMAVHLFHSYQIDSNLIQLETDVSEVFLDLNTAIPCGLIVNELVTNALKHAFPGKRKGEMRIEFRQLESEKYLLTIRDNGVGFPKGLDIRTTETLGMQIVTLLVDQLDGRIELEKNGGTTFKIEFKALKYKSSRSFP